MSEAAVDHPRPTNGEAAAARYRVAERVLDRSAAIARRAFAALVAIAERGRKRPGPKPAAAPPAGPAVLGVGAPPSAVGFAAVHLGADARESSAMRRLADAEAAMPALAAALAEVPLSRRVLQQLAIKAKPETAEVWAQRIRALDHAALRRLVECTPEGESPDAADPRVGEIIDGPLPPPLVAVPVAATQDSGAGAESVDARPPASPATMLAATGGREATPATQEPAPTDAPTTRDSVPAAGGSGARPAVTERGEAERVDGWRFAASVAFSALDFEAFEGAWKHVNAVEHVTHRPVDAIAAMLRRLRAQGVRPDHIADWAATRPRRRWLVDRCTQAVWLETTRGGVEVPRAALPVAPADARWRCRRDLALADGPDGRALLSIRVQAEGGAWVALTPAALAQAAPELRETPARRGPSRRRTRHLPRAGALRPPVDAAAPGADTGSPPPNSRCASDLLDASVDLLGPPSNATADELRALAPSARRVDTVATHAACHALADAAEAGLVRIGADDLVTVHGHPARLSAADARDRLRVGRALRTLPWIDAAFAAGVLTYGKVRVLVRVATPATDARWAAVARRSPVEVVEALVAAAKPGEPPPRVPRGRLPLWPAGRAQRLALHGTVSGPDAADLAAWRARLDALAAVPSTGEALGALAGIYLNTFDRRRRRDRIVYTLAPESRAAADRAARVAPATRAAGPDPADRVRAMFPLLAPVWGRIARRAGGATRRARATALHAARTTQKGAGATRRRGVRPSESMRDAMHARDGVRCITPFCPHGLVIHWGHLGHACDGDPADLASDYPPCGPCNNAVERGELRITRDDAGRLTVTDGAGAPIDPRRRLGLHLDRRLLARLWTQACRALGVDEADCPMPFAAAARAARREAVDGAAEGGAAPHASVAPDAGALPAIGSREASPATQDPRAQGRPSTHCASG